MTRGIDADCERQRRPVYVVHLQALPSVDAIRALRGALKVLLRRFGLRVISVREERK